MFGILAEANRRLERLAVGPGLVILSGKESLIIINCLIGDNWQKEVMVIVIPVEMPDTLSLMKGTQVKVKDRNGTLLGEGTMDDHGRAIVAISAFDGLISLSPEKGTR